MIEYYSVENTGWSGGISWFRIGGNSTNPLRFKNKQDALEYAIERKNVLNQDTTLWRIVHTTIHREDNKETIIREWEQVL